MNFQILRFPLKTLIIQRKTSLATKKLGEGTLGRSWEGPYEVVDLPTGDLLVAWFRRADPRPHMERGSFEILLQVTTPLASIFFFVVVTYRQ